MLTSLSIKNYALIENLEVNFSRGLICITGETGAGKSIVLGGLSLVLGKRADIKMLKEPTKKCAIEAIFTISDYQLQWFFKKHQLDYEPITILRREIIPTGKSRSFINDTPVNLEIVNELGIYLVDIHSQHQTLLLKKTDIHFQVVDAFARNTELLLTYQKNYKQWQEKEKKYKELLNEQNTYIEQKDYDSFLYEELLDADLEKINLSELENEMSQLLNVEELQDLSAKSYQLLEGERGVLYTTREIRTLISKAAQISKKTQPFLERLESVLVELRDIAAEIEKMNETLENNPKRLKNVQNQVEKIYNLQKKHNTNSITELNNIKNEIEKKIQITDNLTQQIENLKTQKETAFLKVREIATQIDEKRRTSIPNLTEEIRKILAYLQMKDTHFKIMLKKENQFFSNGNNTIDFQITTHPGNPFKNIKKVASGGELSRIMLAIKALLSKYKKLPTIIFDEIDSGISGPISSKMAKIMQKMSRSMQVITITHLPQVAASGNHHFKVFKQKQNKTMQTHIKELKQEDRIEEIAKMLSGQELKESAIKHAKELLQFK